MLVVEALRDGAGRRLVEPARPHRHAHLVRLAEVAQVGGAHVLVLLAGEALGVERRGRPGGELVEDLLHGRAVERRVAGDVGLHVVVLDVDGEQAEGRHVARVLRHDDTGEVEDVDEPAREQRPGPAEGGEHEVAHVEATLDRHLAQGVGLVPRGDLEDACGATLLVESQPLSERADAVAGRVHVERDLAAEQVRGDPAEHEVGVGDGRLRAALAVAERAGVGAGRLRPHLEGALGGHPGDRAATGADRDDVDHRDLARVGADRALGGEGRLAVEHHRDVGRGAAAVAGEHPVEAGPPGDEGRTERAGRGAGQHRRDRLVHHLVGGEHAAVGLHHVEGDRAPAGEAVEPGVDVADVAADVRLDRGVDEGGHRALVLAVLAQHLGADRHHGVRVLAAQHLAHRELVGVVGVGVQEAHPDRGDVVRAEPAGGGHGIRLVERAQLVALEVHPAADGAHVVGGDDARRLDPEVGVAVAVGHGLAGDLEHELVALGRDEAEPLDLALEQLVGGDGGAVADGGDVVTGGAQHAEDLLDAGDEPVGGVGGRARRLGGDELAGVLVEGHDVGERAPGVDADPDPSLSVRHVVDSTGRAGRIRCQYLPTEPGSAGQPRHRRRRGPSVDQSDVAVTPNHLLTAAGGRLRLQPTG